MMSNSIFDLENGGSTYTQGNTVGIVPDDGGLNTGSSAKKSGNFFIRYRAWFPYRCICRTKEIHRTDTTLWKPPVQMLNTKETTDTTCCNDRMNSIFPMNFFRTTDTTDTTIWKPGFRGITDIKQRFYNLSSGWKFHAV